MQISPETGSLLAFGGVGERKGGLLFQTLLGLHPEFKPTWRGVAIFTAVQAAQTMLTRAA